MRDGISVSLARDLATEPAPDNPAPPVQHHMLAAGDARDSNGIPGYEGARDYLGFDIHGLTTTHVDALSHMFVRGEMFGGRPASEVRSDGARPTRSCRWPTASSAGASCSTCRGRSGSTSSTRASSSTVADLEAAEATQGVRVGAGDILLVAWGRDARREAHGGFDGMAGLHPECLPWLHEREIAVLGSDGISDPMPFVGIANWPFPIHQVGITGMGLHLIDNMQLARLSSACADAGRW